MKTLLESCEWADIGDIGSRVLLCQNNVNWRRKREDINDMDSPCRSPTPVKLRILPSSRRRCAKAAVRFADLMPTARRLERDSRALTAREYADEVLSSIGLVSDRV